MRNQSADQLSSSLSFFSSEKARELRGKIWFVILVLIVYRIGTYVPLPGIDTFVLKQLNSVHSGGVLGMFNMFTGGALGRMSIFALNIMPYITASIVMQLMTVLSQEVASWKNEAEQGRKKMNQYTRYLTIFLALFQGYGIAVGIETINAGGAPLVLEPGMFFRFVTVLNLLGGTMLVVWMSEQINSHGIGNGSSLIIFTGIVSGLPAALIGFFEMGKTGAISSGLILFVLALVIAMVLLVVIFEKAQRRIAVNYPKRQVGNKMYGGDSTHMPLKLNTAGVIPAIFASSLLLFPTTIAGFSSAEVGGVKQFIASYLSHGKPLFILLYALLICFFCFFYTSVVFNPTETAENLRKNGGVVLGRRPGAHTAEYFDYVLTRITVLGAAYMVLVCVMPEILLSQYSLPFYLSGTSVLIVVNVVIDLMSQIQTQLLSVQYEALLKKSKIRSFR